MEENTKKYEKKVEKIEDKAAAKKEEKNEEKKSEKKGFWKRLKEKKLSKEQLEKQQLLQKSEISIWIDTYDDVFSDFDSRPYSQRAISDDFLRESQKMSRETRKGKFEVHLMAPSIIRNEEHENMVKKRLKEHFKNNAKSIEEEIESLKKGSAYLIIFGAVLLAIATIIAYQESRSLLLLILLTILEPAGWFTMWTGLDRLFYETKKKKPELEYNLKMANAEINFVSY